MVLMGTMWKNLQSESRWNSPLQLVFVDLADCNVHSKLHNCYHFLVVAMRDVIVCTPYIVGVGTDGSDDLPLEYYGFLHTFIWRELLKVDVSPRLLDEAVE